MAIAAKGSGSVAEAWFDFDAKVLLDYYRELRFIFRPLGFAIG